MFYNHHFVKRDFSAFPDGYLILMHGYIDKENVICKFTLSKELILFKISIISWTSQKYGIQQHFFFCNAFSDFFFLYRKRDTLVQLKGWNLINSSDHTHWASMGNGKTCPTILPRIPLKNLVGNFLLFSGTFFTLWIWILDW